MRQSGEKYKEIGQWTVGQQTKTTATGRQTGRRTDRQTYRQTDRQEATFLMTTRLVCFICSAIGFRTANQIQAECLVNRGWLGVRSEGKRGKGNGNGNGRAEQLSS